MFSFCDDVYSVRKHANPFYKQDTNQQAHLSESFPLEEFCEALSKFPNAGIEFVKSLELVQHHDGLVQKGVSKYDMEGREIRVIGSRKRVPLQFWWTKLKEATINKGHPVVAKLVPIKGIAGPNSQFLSKLVKASIATKNYSAFNNEVVKAVIEHKWQSFTRMKVSMHAKSARRSLFACLPFLASLYVVLETPNSVRIDGILADNRCVPLQRR